jgi:hypothetical protein
MAAVKLVIANSEAVTRYAVSKKILGNMIGRIECFRRLGPYFVSPREITATARVKAWAGLGLGRSLRLAFVRGQGSTFCADGRLAMGDTWVTYCYLPQACGHNR